MKPRILALSPDAFTALLTKNNIKAFHIVTRNGRFEASHPVIQPIADYFKLEASDFDGHEGLFVSIGPQSGTLQSAVIHRTCRGAGSGGVRNWGYETVEGFLRDGLRLSKGMTHKNALAGLWWGGGKGVIARNSGKGLDTAQDSALLRQKVFEDYGEFLSHLKGCFVAAQDAGITREDIVHLHSRTRFTTCVPVEMGGSGVPAIPTARGIAVAMEAAFDHLGMSIKGASVAIQGVGAVGSHLVECLFQLGVARIVGCGVDPKKKSGIEARFRQYGDRFSFRTVDKGDHSILFEDVDAIAPCATGAIINASTIPQIRAKIICGGANNQLLDMKTDDKLLRDSGITYVPDFLCNRMGIVNCADEHLGSMKNDPKIEVHLGRNWSNSIYNVTRQVLFEAKETGLTTQEISIKLAEEQSRIQNPLYGHRGQLIIDSLVASDSEWSQLVRK